LQDHSVGNDVRSRRAILHDLRATQFGLNIRVTVERGDALTACWVSGIGGNFE